MIILPNVPFEKQAKFLHDNICGYPDSPEFAKVLSEQATDVAGGLKAHKDLLGRIYADITCIEGKNDKEKYIGLVATMAFLYAFFAFGTLVHEHDRYSVLINKDILQQMYRTGDFTKRKRHLEHHGFSVKYLSAQGESESMSKASQLSISYDHHPSLIPAVKFFAESIESIQGNMIKYLYGKMAMFLKGDFEAGILRKPTPREALNPLRNDILDTVDEYKHEWTVLVSLFRDKCGLKCSGFWHYGFSPSWGVSFFEKGTKPMAIFTLGSNIVFVEFTLPLSSAERIIRERRSYSDSIREKIESFHCGICPKKCKGKNITKIDGVWLCKGRAETRRIYTTLTSPKDFESIHTMLDITC